MSVIKKNKIHNPQLITSAPPSSVGENDIGRLWVDLETDSIKIALRNKGSGMTELRDLLDTDNMSQMNNTYFKGIRNELKNVELQKSGDEHFDNGYDFFSDPIYLENSTQNYDNYYSYFYIEVQETTDPLYLRSISTDVGVKHIRRANGLDSYSYQSQMKPHVQYTKIVLDIPAKEIIDIIFDNKDSLTVGYKLTADKKTILIYSDPDGFFNNKQVLVKYLI